MSNSLVAYDMHLYWMKVDEKTFQLNPMREFVIRYSNNIEALVIQNNFVCDKFGQSRKTMGPWTWNATLKNRQRGWGMGMISSTD